MSQSFNRGTGRKGTSDAAWYFGLDPTAAKAPPVPSLVSKIRRFLIIIIITVYFFILI